LNSEWEALGVTDARSLHGQQAVELWDELREFPVAGDAPLVIKASLPSSQTTAFVRLVQEIDPAASIAAHAGNGIVVVRFSRFEAGDVSRALVGRLQPAAQLVGGAVVVLSTTLSGLTRQTVWGGTSQATEWMGRVKRQFDPKNLLNPGRFVYINP
jgi:glycolate oxidase FAD binding subunit